MLFRCVASDCGLTLLTLFNLRQIVIVRSVYLLPYNLGSYLVFSIDHRGQMSARHWSPDIGLIVKVYLLFFILCQDFVIMSLLLLPLGKPYLVNTMLMEGTPAY